MANKIARLCFFVKFIILEIYTILILLFFKISLTKLECLTKYKIPTSKPIRQTKNLVPYIVEYALNCVAYFELFQGNYLEI